MFCSVSWPVLTCYDDEWITGRGFPIYQKVIGNMFGCEQKWLHTRTCGLDRVMGRCPTLHQSRVQPNGAPRSLSSCFCLLCKISPPILKFDNVGFSLCFKGSLLLLMWVFSQMWIITKCTLLLLGILKLRQAYEGQSIHRRG